MDDQLLKYREAAVKSAMEDWKKGIREKTHHEEIDRIVKQSGFANRMEWKSDGRASQMWCGMFCSCHLLNAGLNQELRSGMWHVSNVENFFCYKYEKRVPKWVLVKDKNIELKEYHSQKNTPRLWITHKMIKEMIGEDGPHMVGFADVGLVGPGDILLVDGDSNGKPNHITMVKEYKKGIITTIEGNAGGIINVPGEDGVTQRVQGDSVALNFRDLSKEDYKKIYGIGRFSYEDFNRALLFEK